MNKKELLFFYAQSVEILQDIVEILTDEMNTIKYN